MRNVLLLVVAVVVAAAGTLAAADSPHVGKWKMNDEKSDPGLTVAYSQTGSGEMQFTTAGQSYTFKTDSKDYSALFGTTASWKQIDANTWERNSKQKGSILSTDTIKLSADRKTMTEVSKGTKPNGQSSEDIEVYERVSGGPALSGQWKPTQAKSSSPTVVEFAPYDSDGLTLRTDTNVTCNFKFDGKDYPATGPNAPPNLTYAFRRTGERSFDVTMKIDGKTYVTFSQTVSADGKTLTLNGTVTGSK